MKREPLTNLQIIEYLKRTKEDTTIEEHRMAIDEAIKDFEDKELHVHSPVVIAKILYDNWVKVEIGSPCVNCNIAIGDCPFDEMRDVFKNKDWKIQLLVKDCKHHIKKDAQNHPSPE